MKKAPFFTEEECRKLAEECCKPHAKPVALKESDDNLQHSDSIIEKIKSYRDASLERCKVLNNKNGSVEYILTSFQSNKGIHSEFLQESDKISDIENFELAKNDNFDEWVIHHRLETRGFGYTSEELISLGLYFKRPASELIYLKTTVHSQLHADYRKKANQIRNNLTQCIK